MTERAPPEESELLEVVRTSFGDRAVSRVTRRPYRFATSSPLEELRVSLSDGTDVPLIFKDLAWERLLDGARRSKPPFLYEPRREIETHRSILAPARVGARCYAAVVDSDRSRYWLLLEKVPGRELWQVGELEVWEAVARWLGRFHTSFAGRVADVRAVNPFLLEWDSAWLGVWSQRAREALRQSEDPRSPALLDVLDRYEEAVEPVLALPATLVHGEFYPSNVVVVGDVDDLRVCPIDWEMAATGPGLIDVAALVSGWGDTERDRLVAAYHSARRELDVDVAPRAEMVENVDRCRLLLAVQWLGWSADWQAPPEHAHDWIGEALAVARRLAR